MRSIEISDVSGAAVLKSPEIRQLLTLIDDPEIHGVVTRDFSRLMRPEDFGDFAMLQAFVNSNTILYLPDGPIDFASKTGRLLGPLRAVMAGMERTDILERMWNIKEEKRRNGGFAQAKICLPFGVTYNSQWSYTPEAEQVREAFRLILAGDTSYSSVGKRVGIDPYSLRVILRNPIYTGWRVIDKKRDPSPAGKYTTKDGRQGDRRKIKRAPDEVIRVQVIKEPLVSEAEFNQVQKILELKRIRHWRTREGYESRFTYRGLLVCSICEGPIYTKYRRADYYVCKARHIEHTCGAGYMRRERIESELDALFAERLTSAKYLRQVEREFKQTRPQADTERLVNQLDSLSAKRQRVLDSYFEGVINPTERDMRLAEIEREKRVIGELISRARPTGMDVKTLAQIFRVFLKFNRLESEKKRRLLTALAPEILVAEYQVKGLFFSMYGGPTAAGSLGNERIWLPIAA